MVSTVWARGSFTLDGVSIAAGGLPAGVVHATFNLGDEDATVLAILGPCVGEMGAENIDVSGEAPWNELRAKAA